MDSDKRDYERIKGYRITKNKWEVIKLSLQELDLDLNSKSYSILEDRKNEVGLSDFKFLEYLKLLKVLDIWIKTFKVGEQIIGFYLKDLILTFRSYKIYPPNRYFKGGVQPDRNASFYYSTLNLPDFVTLDFETSPLIALSITQIIYKEKWELSEESVKKALIYMCAKLATIHYKDVTDFRK